MERSGILAFVNKAVCEYYEFGVIDDIRAVLTDDAIAFGINSQHYIQGREAVMSFLAERQKALPAISVNRVNCGEIEKGREVTVRVMVNFSTVRRRFNMHRILVMWQEAGENDYRICGINVQKGFASFYHSLRFDKLTNLYNKKEFCRRVAAVIASHPEMEFEIMRFNVARFKVINDLFGEEMGDKLLKYVAQFLTSIQLEACVYGRLYADNFMLCYPTVGNIREHLIHSLQMLAVSFALDYRIEFYFGVYTVKERNLTVTTMLDRAAMEKKLTAMYDLGVRDFAIFFDDIKNKDARGQAEFLNWVNEYFIAKHPDVSPLITVPTEYFRQDMVENGTVKKYTRDFSETLDKNIMVLYTGEKVVPDGLTDADYQAACSLYGRQLGIWWNYPVSDYLEAKLALGPVEKLPQTSVIPAIFFNPMKHAELSKISLATGADYAQNPGQYNARKSWQKAFAEQYGRLAADMEAFADHSQHMVVSWAVIGPEDGTALRAVFNDYWQADNAARSSHKEKAIQELIKLDKSVAALQLQLTEKQLAECQPQLAQLRRIIKADLTGLAVLAGETDKKAVFKKEMQEVIAHDKTERISEKCVRAFLNELAEHIDGKKNNK